MVLVESLIQYKENSGRRGQVLTFGFLPHVRLCGRHFLPNIILRTYLLGLDYFFNPHVCVGSFVYAVLEPEDS